MNLTKRYEKMCIQEQVSQAYKVTCSWASLFKTNWTNNNLSLSLQQHSLLKSDFFENLKLTCSRKCPLPRALNAASDLKIWILTISIYVCKNEKNHCVVILFHRHASDKFQEVISLKHSLDISLAYPSPMLISFDQVMFQFINIKCVLFWSNLHMAPMFKTRFLWHVHPWSLW